MALEMLAREASETVEISDRWVAVMKMSHICHHYLNQVQFPGRRLEQTQKIGNTCLETARSLLKNLASGKAAMWTGSSNLIFRSALTWVCNQYESPTKVCC
jgi:hypothetical protein